MQNISTTQGSNFTIIAAALVIIVSKINDITTLTVEDYTTIMAAVAAIYAGAVSAVNRYKKGDITLGGKYKE